MAVAVEADLADPGLDDLQADDAPGQFLFRRGHQHRAVALFAVGILDRLKGFLDVAIDPPHTGIGCHAARQIVGSVSGNLEALDVEADSLLPDNRRGHQ